MYGRDGNGKFLDGIERARVTRFGICFEGSCHDPSTLWYKAMRSWRIWKACGPIAPQLARALPHPENTSGNLLSACGTFSTVLSSSAISLVFIILGRKRDDFGWQPSLQERARHV